MLKVALTGGIATGKSYVLERFRQLGVPCLDADALAHGVMAPGTEAARAIAARFGADILDADGAVNRKKLAAIVSRPDRTWFYKLTGPTALVATERENFIRFVKSVKY